MRFLNWSRELEEYNLYNKLISKSFLIKEKLETAKAGPKVEFWSTRIMKTRGKVTAIKEPISGEKLIENSANNGVSIVSNLSSFWTINGTESSFIDSENKRYIKARNPIVPNFTSIFDEFIVIFLIYHS